MTQTIGPLEQKVMHVVWTEKEATVSKVLMSLNAQSKKELAYTTIMTVLQRLHEKKLIGRKKQRRTFVYFAKTTEQSFVQQLVKSTINNLMDRFGEDALAAFMTEARALSKKKTAR